MKRALLLLVTMMFASHDQVCILSRLFTYYLLNFRAIERFLEKLLSALQLAFLTSSQGEESTFDC